MTIVHVDDIWFERQGSAILRGIGWQIEAGSHWALLGANGAGKTALLKIVTGYEWPTRGRVYVLGQRFGACNIPELRMMVGWVSSALEYRFPDYEAAVDVVLSGLDATLGIYRAFSEEERERATAALEHAGALSLADHAYATLSQGERQRVLIARALIAKPRLLVLDEPCAGLDPAARHCLLEDLASLATGNGAPTIIYVTHHIEEIGGWINKVLVLKNGSVLSHGYRDAVLRTPVLSQAFGVPCQVTRTHGAYTLNVFPAPRD